MLLREYIKPNAQYVQLQHLQQITPLALMAKEMLQAKSSMPLWLYGKDVSSTLSQGTFRLSLLLLILNPQWKSFAAMPPFSSILLTTPLYILSKTLGTPA